MSRTIKYEIETCGRCGGSGEFSYNPRDGRVCFGCKGTGKVHTPDGADAKRKIRALRDSLTTAAARDISAGDRIVDRWALSVRGRRVRTVGQIRQAHEHDSSDVYLTFKERPNCAIGLCMDDVVHRAPDTAVFDRMIELAERLPGAIIEINE